MRQPDTQAGAKGDGKYGYQRNQHQGEDLASQAADPGHISWDIGPLPCLLLGILAGDAVSRCIVECCWVLRNPAATNLRYEECIAFMSIA